MTGTFAVDGENENSETFVLRRIGVLLTLSSSTGVYTSTREVL